MQVRLPGPRTSGVAIGLGRLSLGAAFLALPEASTRVLGLDAVTAKRIVWLARMTAIRDIALAAGTLASSTRRRDASWWLLGGAVSDAVDSAAIAAAVRSKRLPAAKAAPMAIFAAGAAGFGAIVAEQAHRQGH